MVVDLYAASSTDEAEMADADYLRIPEIGSTVTMGWRSAAVSAVARETPVPPARVLDRRQSHAHSMAQAMDHLDMVRAADLRDKERESDVGSADRGGAQAGTWKGDKGAAKAADRVHWVGAGSFRLSELFASSKAVLDIVAVRPASSTEDHLARRSTDPNHAIAVRGRGVGVSASTSAPYEVPVTPRAGPADPSDLRGSTASGGAPSAGGLEMTQGGRGRGPRVHRTVTPVPGLEVEQAFQDSHGR